MYISLKNKQSYTSKHLRAILSSQSVSNIFNPSIRYHNDKIYIAFRGKNTFEGKPFDAYLLIIEKNFEQPKLINLTNTFSGYVHPVADPKLLTIKNELWVTFNTGWSKEPNNIYLCQLTPSVKTPKKCVYQKRQHIEKNWSFFQQDDKLFALYALENCKLICSDLNTDNNTIIFYDYNAKLENKFELKNYTQGSQIVNYEGYKYLIGHKKIILRGKRIYLGRMLRFNLNNRKFVLDLSKKYIFHSLGALCGSKTKHNPNLFSCTYFSGLSFHNSKILMSYGINDIDFNFSEISYNILW
jgi:hypothetical protein